MIHYKSFGDPFKSSSNSLQFENCNTRIFLIFELIWEMSKIIHVKIY